MLLDAANLGDQGTKRPDGTFDPNWLAAFKQDIHGLVLVAGDSRDSVRESLTQIEQIFHIGHNNASIKEVLRLVGDVRPGVERGHEQYALILAALICMATHFITALASSTVYLNQLSLASITSRTQAKTLSNKESSL